MHRSNETAEGEAILEDLAEHLYGSLNEDYPCDGSLRSTQAWLQENVPEWEADLTVWANDRGAACDCRLLGSIVGRTPEQGCCEAAGDTSQEVR